MLVMSYGTGDLRPKLNSEDTVFRISGEAHHVAIICLYLYAYKRDTASYHFVGWDAIGSLSGISILSQEGEMRSHLFEDNRINYFDDAITILGNVRHDDIVIRRNVIQNVYNRAQGIFAHSASVLLEENVFDHNGWYQQRFPNGSGKDEGQATIFNHNTFFGKAEPSEWFRH